MVNIIVFSIFAIMLGLLVSGALSMYISGEKGHSTTKGFLIGFFLPIIGIVIVSFKKETKEKIAREMYDNKLMTRKGLEKAEQIIDTNNKK